MSKTHYEGWSMARMIEKRDTELAQVCAELVQAQTEAARLGTALADACAARDALAQERDQADTLLDDAMRIMQQERIAAQEQNAELAQAQRRLAVLSQTCAYCGYRCSAGTNTENFNAVAEHIKSCPKHPLAGALAELAQARANLADSITVRQSMAQMVEERDAELEKTHEYTRRMVGLVAERDVKLAQARKELKDLQGANREFARQLADVTENRDYWYETCLTAERERNKARQDAQDQRDPAEAEGLKKQLAEMKTRRDYWYKEGRCNNERLQAERDKWRRDWESTMAELLNAHERLATLDAAEAALEGCGIDGIRDKFNGLADAIEQMAAHIFKLGELVADAEIAEHVHGKSLDEMAQTVQTERQLRQEAEAIARDRDNICYEEYSKRLEAERELRQRQHQIDLLSGAELRGYQAEQRAEKDANYIQWLHRILGEGGYILSANEDGVPVLALNPMQKLKREKAEADQRAQRAEALAALVTPKLANSLILLAGATEYPQHCTATVEDARVARALAAEIREALEGE
ncbi:MAG: hypothetical protein KAJ19_27610 [Gammaproteobacteria bacterium]|nr:hypothetical protein [Gammaproteobacteria bacterium]